MVPFLVPFWITFGFQNGSQNGAKSGSKFGKFWLYFWIAFLLKVWGSLGALGSLLGSLEIFLEASGLQKLEKTNGFSRFLDLQSFGFVNLLMALLGSS